MFKYILDKLFCKHSWKVFSQTKSYKEGQSEAKGNLPIRITQILICQKCGKIKQITMD